MKGVVIPQSGSYYNKLEKTPVGKFNYWSDVLLGEYGEKTLENLMKFEETAEQIATDPTAMNLIMGETKLYITERSKITLGIGAPNNKTQTIFTVPKGKIAIITDYVLSSHSNYSGYLCINNKQITNSIGTSSSSTTQHISLYHRASGGSKIQIYGSNSSLNQTVFGYLMDIKEVL